jgi:hypothetical protein
MELTLPDLNYRLRPAAFPSLPGAPVDSMTSRQLRLMAGLK